jgi:hypothetical protein
MPRRDGTVSGRRLSRTQLRRRRVILEAQKTLRPARSRLAAHKEDAER